MSEYESLPANIAEDVLGEIKANTISTRADLERYISESVQGSEVTFKSVAARKFLEANGVFRDHHEMQEAASLLEELVREELSGHLAYERIRG
jgi:hypothetical protein